MADGEDDTVKRCPAFIDAMTQGFLIPLICDVTVKDGEFTWDNDLPAGGTIAYARSPIGLHDAGQVAGTPLAHDDRFLIKFHNLWTIEGPPGYALLFTHPVNRFDLPFTTLTGLVDCDRYKDAWIHFPGPVARREASQASCPGTHASGPVLPDPAARPGPRTPEAMSEAQAQQAHELMTGDRPQRRASTAGAFGPSSPLHAQERRRRAGPQEEAPVRRRGERLDSRDRRSPGGAPSTSPCAGAASPASRWPSSSRPLPSSIRMAASPGRAASAWAVRAPPRPRLAVGGHDMRQPDQGVVPLRRGGHGPRRRRARARRRSLRLSSLR